METNNTKTEQISEKNCPCCGASMKMHWHRLSKGLANTLIEFKKEILKRKINKIHIKDECRLSKTQFNNFQKLRYHGLVAKYKNPITKAHEGGYWLLTRRGNLFLKNELAIPLKVQTFRNKIVDKTDELYLLKDILDKNDMPIWDAIGDFEFDYAGTTDID